MRFLRGRTQNNRIIIKVGIWPFQPYEPVDGTGGLVDVTYREYQALVDTGAIRTCISEKAVQELGLKRKSRANIWNVRRSEVHWTYLFHLGIWPDSEDPSVPTAVFGIGEPIEGIDVGNHPYFDVLLGMDIIGQGSLRIDLDGSFEMAFPD
jgi:hypothetical protein